MADAIKRVGMSRNKPFQDRCMYFMYQQADTVFGQDTPDPDDLALAKALWAGQVKAEDMARVVMTNATIGGHIDNDETITDAEITDAEIEYVVVTENKFHDLALAYSAAGLT